MLACMILLSPHSHHEDGRFDREEHGCDEGHAEPNPCLGDPAEHDGTFQGNEQGRPCVCVCVCVVCVTVCCVCVTVLCVCVTVCG